MECVEQAEHGTPSECALWHIGHLDNRPNSFHVFNLFRLPPDRPKSHCETEMLRTAVQGQKQILGSH